MYADALRERFYDLAPVVDDLLLLEPHQVAALPQRAPLRELGAVLCSRPELVRFLVTKHPPIEPFVATLLDRDKPSQEELVAASETLLWEIADMIVYQRAPELYDERVESSWERSALAEIEPLEGKVIVDAGAGTGHVTFAIASACQVVFAVEPVASLRAYIRDKAHRKTLGNVYVIDGTLAAVPLPDGSADALITQRALGWDLDSELAEIERVVKPGGVALHLLGVPCPAAPDAPLHEELLANGYEQASYVDGQSLFRKYSKRIEEGK